MIKLFFDIETLPAEEANKKEYSAILKKKNGKVSLTDDETYLKTSFDGTFGRICCIGYILEQGETIERGVLSGDEKEILKKFWELAKNVYLFIGHNILDIPIRVAGLFIERNDKIPAKWTEYSANRYSRKVVKEHDIICEVSSSGREESRLILRKIID